MMTYAAANDTNEEYVEFSTFILSPGSNRTETVRSVRRMIHCHTAETDG